jgi:hypothetical protein
LFIYLFNDAILPSHYIALNAEISEQKVGKAVEAVVAKSDVYLQGLMGTAKR